MAAMNVTKGADNRLPLTLVTGYLGAGKTIDTQNIKDPVVGFIYGSKGLMYNLTLEGTKITQVERK